MSRARRTYPNPSRDGRPTRRLLAVALVAGLIGVVGVWTLLRRSPDIPATTFGGAHAPAAPDAIYVGRAACKDCHAIQDKQWQGSQHDLAMQSATAQTVLGDFTGATYTHDGVTTTFSKRDGTFFVRTDGPDGALHDYEVAYTYGVAPIQQYLIPFPNGRYQALSIAWDTRAKSDGGQRWFHLYGSEHIGHDDELHWTRAQQNWNTICADCHSTDLRKNYDAATDTFKTTWSEVNVSCEACHGPGSRHVAWARRPQAEARTDATKGLATAFGQRRASHWTMDEKTGTAHPERPGPVNAEVDVCAPCHSRRTTIAAGFAAGKPFLDFYQPELLDPPLYYADGQQRGEVYIWASFLQSKMYQQGVTCSDCHEPHSGKLQAIGNAVCTRCHAPVRFDAKSHHFHEPGKPGAQCVSCHMPETTYMVVDPRRDHSLRVPRPDLSVSDGLPNACIGCHRGKPATWAAERVAKWYGHQPSGLQQFAPAFRAAANHDSGSTRSLAALVDNPREPEIVRATALGMMGRNPDVTAIAAASVALGDPSPLVRHAALGGLAALQPADRVRSVAPLLDDPSRVVRSEAARLLAAVPSSSLAPANRASFGRAAAEYEESQRLHADRPEHRTNLGTFLADRGRYQEAEAELRAAIRVNADYVPAWANLADLQRAQGRDQDAERLLRQGLERMPRDGSLHHALGLTLSRLQRADEAVRELNEAARLAPDNPRFAYVYAVALNSNGKTREALATINRALGRFPTDRDLLVAAATISRDAGDRASAVKYAERLLAQSPGDPAARQFVEDVRSGASGR